VLTITKERLKLSQQWPQHSTNLRDNYCITHGHRISCWTIRSRATAAPRFQSIGVECTYI